MIYSMKPDGSDRRIYVTGIKNAVGLTWENGSLYATNNGVDHLGLNAPNDTLYKLKKGEDYGWPYCYEANGEIYEDDTRSWSRPHSCEGVPLSFSAFDAHAAPLGVEYFEKAPSVIEGSFLVALHGSFRTDVDTGSTKIVRVSGDGEQEIFMTGFENESRKRFGRPVDFLEYGENAFFFTDDFGGRIYYVYQE